MLGEPPFVLGTQRGTGAWAAFAALTGTGAEFDVSERKACGLGMSSHAFLRSLRHRVARSRFAQRGAQGHATRSSHAFGVCYAIKYKYLLFLSRLR